MGGREAVIFEVILKLGDEGKVVSRITTAETTTMEVPVAGASASEWQTNSFQLETALSINTKSLPHPSFGSP